MKDGKARSKAEILKEVEANLGRQITPIAVSGTLVNSKHYEKKEDGQFVYRALQ
jgi:hypothetical protein